MQKLIFYLKIHIYQLYVIIMKYCFSSLFKRNYTHWYKWQFLSLPYRSSFNSKEDNISSIVIISMKYLHDSGFKCMDFVAIREDKPVCRLSGSADVINLDGIGGLGKDWLCKNSTLVSPKDWSIDSLPTSGLLRIFFSGYLVAGADLSNFELYAIVPEK